MSTTPTEVDLDQSGNITLKFRKGEGRPFTFTFLEDSAAHDISSYGFVFQVFEIDGTDPVFELTEDSGGGLTNNGAAGTLVVDPSNEDLDLDPKTYEWKLKSTELGRTLFHGRTPINASPRTDTAEDGASVELDLGETNITVNLTVAGFDLTSLTEQQKYNLWLELEKYATGQTPD